MDKGLQAGYEVAFREYRFIFSRGGAYTGIVLILLGVILDYGIYPHEQLQFAAARLICSALIFVLILMMETEWGKDRIQTLTFMWLLLPQIMICWMIAVTDGARSIFYGGLNLAIFASGIALPFGLKVNVTLG
nr:two-component sensor histidine kinase [Burkholderiales bacterium]